MYLAPKSSQEVSFPQRGSTATDSFAAASTILNATLTNYGSTSSLTTPVCCYVSELGVIENIWYTGSIEVTVATASTVIYKYNNTAITSRTTIKANSTTTFPPGINDGLRIPGIPTDLVGTSLGLYPDGTSMVYGTELTDNYGVVYASPTPVWSYGGVSGR